MAPTLKVIFSFLVVLVVSVAAEDRKRAPLLACDSSTKIKDEYIVVLKEELSDDEVEVHKNIVRTAIKIHGNFSKMVSEYSIGKGFRGYHIVADPKLVETLRTMSAVKYIEHNQEMHVHDDCTCVCDVEWGLHRTAVKGNEDYTKGEYYIYSEDAAGDGVDVYIIDTGIYTEHEEFEMSDGTSRAKFGTSFITTDGSDSDGNGHGTHVAGTVIGKTYGLARKATAIAVKVLNKYGSGSTSGVISGVDWVGDEHDAKTNRPSVANMSLGGGKSTALNDAVNAVINKGVHFAVAAGNENGNACNVSPASSDAVTVASVETPADGSSTNFPRSSFSNYGTCVDIFAPGSGIKSAWIGSKDTTNTISGTSMASPHVAGVMAKILSAEDESPSSMKNKLKTTASTGIVGDVKGSPNLLVYHGCNDETCSC